MINGVENPIARTECERAVVPLQGNRSNAHKASRVENDNLVR